ncbi:hypothetical protein A2U01_0093476, partial [Trifolium medium]|nr:hypothetical protein [Trifolium medium]
TTTVGSFQRPDCVELLVGDLADAALADADAEADLTSFTKVSAVVDAVVADAAVAGLTRCPMVSPDPGP